MEQHSVYKTDPYGRLDRTVRSVEVQVYGGAQAAVEGRRLRRLHRDITGVDSHGRRYSALNPDAYLWVHATTFETFLVFMSRFVRAPTSEETQQLFDEWRRLGLLLGIKDRHLPRTVEEFWQTWERLLARCEDNPVVQDLLHNAPKPPPGLPLPESVTRLLARPFLSLRREIIAWTVPDELRETIGLPALTPLQEWRLECIAAASRLAGRVLPSSLRYLPRARRAHAQASHGMRHASVDVAVRWPSTSPAATERRRRPG